MDIEAPQIPSRRRADALQEAALIACAQLDGLVRTLAQRLPPQTMIGVGLLALGVAAFARVRGADVGFGFAGGQPSALSNVLMISVGRDGQPPRR
jgi:hypothetical protein